MKCWQTDAASVALDKACDVAADEEVVQCVVMVAVTMDGESTRMVLTKKGTTLLHLSRALVELETQAHGIKTELFLRNGTKPRTQTPRHEVN